jgi:predicted Fe-Mo cluster-binding NifX family protein
MKIAVTSERTDLNSPIDTRFGRAKYFLVYDTEKNTYSAIDNKQNLNAEQGAGIQSAQNIINCGVDCIITGHCGPKAFGVLNKANVKVYLINGGTVKEALDAFKNGQLKAIEQSDVVEGHWA